MPPRKIAFNIDVEKARFEARSSAKKIINVGPFVEDSFDVSTGIDAGLSSNWAFDGVEKVVRQNGVAMATVVSVPVTFASNVAANVSGLWEEEGTVRVYFSRNNGANWTQLTDGAQITIGGPAGKVVRLKAELDPGAILKGWSAHW